METRPAAAGEAAMEDVEALAGEGDDSRTTAMPAAITGVLVHNNPMAARLMCQLNLQTTISCTVHTQDSFMILTSILCFGSFHFLFGIQSSIFARIVFIGDMQSMASEQSGF